jgi:hypothetical protein
MAGARNQPGPIQLPTTTTATSAAPVSPPPPKLPWQPLTGLRNCLNASRGQVFHFYAGETTFSNLVEREMRGQRCGLGWWGFGGGAVVRVLLGTPPPPPGSRACARCAASRALLHPGCARAAAPRFAFSLAEAAPRGKLGKNRSILATASMIGGRNIAKSAGPAPHQPRQHPPQLIERQQ